jgi:mono/diheme cytochrome c family protein
LRYYAFSTQYFFIAPFVFWVASLPEKALDRPRQITEPRPKYFGKVVLITCGFLIAIAYLHYQVPQLVSVPPKKVEFDPSQVKTKADLVKVGEKLFFGKGQCALCHSIGPTHGARAPDLKGVGAKLTREFIEESLIHPSAYLYKQYGEEGPPKPFPSEMPAIDKPPVGLSEPELLAIIAFVQNLGGEVTVEPEEVNTFMPATALAGDS